MSSVLFQFVTDILSGKLENYIVLIPSSYISSVHVILHYIFAEIFVSVESCVPDMRFIKGLHEQTVFAKNYSGHFDL